MKNPARSTAIAATLAAIFTFSLSAGTVQAASTTPAPKPVQPQVVTPDSHPVPNCPWSDPNGCGIYSN